MSINYGDMECSPHMIARQEREADARLNTTEGCDVCGGFFGHRLNCEVLEAEIQGDAEQEDRHREYEIWAQEMRDLED